MTATVQMWLAPMRPFGDFTLRLEGIGLPIAVATTAPAAKDTATPNSFDIVNRPDREADHRLSNELPPNDSANEFWSAALDPISEITAAAAGSNTASLAAGQSTAESDNPSAYAKLVGTRVRALPAALALPIAFAVLAIVLGIARCGWQTISLRRKLAHCQLIDAGPARKLLDELLRTVETAPRNSENVVATVCSLILKIEESQGLP